jgi:ERF superfamily
METLIASKMAAVLADTTPVEKNGVNSQQGFKFRSIDDTVGSVRRALIKHSVAILPEVLNVERSTYQTKSGMVMNVADVLVSYTFLAEDGSSVVTTMAGQAADSGDKAVSKALSMAFKYLCFQTFLCGTDGDPDSEVAPEAATEPHRGLSQADKTRLTALGKKYGLAKEQLKATIQDAIGREIASTADLTKEDMAEIEAYLAETDA